MADTTSVLTDVSTSSRLSRVTLADGSTSQIDGLGTASLSSSLSLSSVSFGSKFLSNLLFTNNFTKSLN